MISEAIEPQRWSAARWWALVGLVLVTQFGLIFWLGKPHSVAPARTDSVPVLELSCGAGSGVDHWTWNGSVDPASALSNLTPAQVMALADPTLLALPHWEGFSGPAWLIFTNQAFPSFEWSEASRWLELGEEQLGSGFKDFMATNQFDALPSLEQQKLALSLPAFEQAELPPAHSRLWLAGGLAGRRLLLSPDLPPWPSAEILTNTVVQLLVAADGTPVSTSLLKTRVAPNQADDYALREARKIRFEPINVADPSDPMAGLTWGQLVFEWHTLPLPPTNNAARPPSPK